MIVTELLSEAPSHEDVLTDVDMHWNEEAAAEPAARATWTTILCCATRIDVTESMTEVQPVEPATEVVPAPQGWHVVAAMAAEKVPDTHGVHEPASAPEEVPPGQSEQVAEPVPLLDRPAEQTVQGELPDAAARPATQAVQEPASAPEEVPPGQSEQVAEPVPLLDRPAEQTVLQVEFEVAPVAVETRPATQKNKTDQLRSAFDGESTGG